MDDSTSVAIAIIDDDPALRTTLKLLFDMAGYDVRDFSSIEDFEVSEQKESIACIVLDNTLPGLSGLNFLQKYNRATRSFEVILLTAYGTVPTALAAMKAGAFEFIEKPFEPAKLLILVRNATLLARGRSQRVAAERQLRDRMATLTSRELDVLDHLLRGVSTKEIASLLGISPRTVEVHRGRVMEKLDCHGPIDLYRSYHRLMNIDVERSEF